MLPLSAVLPKTAKLVTLNPPFLIWFWLPVLMGGSTLPPVGACDGSLHAASATSGAMMISAITAPLIKNELRGVVICMHYNRERMRKIARVGAIGDITSPRNPLSHSQ